MMPEQIKSILRSKFLVKRNKLKKKDIIKKSENIYNRLIKLKEFQKAKTIMFYVSFNSEVDTHLMIKKLLTNKKKYAKLDKSDAYRKSICVPVVIGNKIIASTIKNFNELNNLSNYGILEPKRIVNISKKDIDMTIIPGIIFDSYGFRIGYGKGYYDKFLKDYNGFKVGICFKSQLIEKIPITDNDIPVDLVIFDK